MAISAMSRRASPRPPSSTRRPSRTQRVQHAAPRDPWRASPGSTTPACLNVRSSTQTPFLTRRALCATVRSAARQACGCSASASAAASAASRRCSSRTSSRLPRCKTGRPVKLELTREEQFIGDHHAASDAHRREGGRRRDGTLTALATRRRSPTPAPTAIIGGTCCFMPAASAIGVYRCPNKKVDGVRRLYQHGAGRRLPRLRPEPDRTSPSNPRSTSWRSSSASTDSRCAAATSSSPAIRMVSTGRPNTTTSNSAATARSVPRPGRAARWRRGDGIAAASGRHGSSARHGARHDRHRAARTAISPRRGIALRADGDYELSSARPNSATARRRSIARSPPTALGDHGRSGSRMPPVRHRSMAATTPARSAAPAPSWPAPRPSARPKALRDQDRRLCRAALPALMPRSARCSDAVAGGGQPSCPCGDLRSPPRRRGRPRRDRPQRRHAALGRLQRAGVPGRRATGHRRDHGSCAASMRPMPARSSIRCSAAARSRAASRRRSAPTLYRRGRARPRRTRSTTRRSATITSGLCRRAAHRSAVRRHLRQPRAVRREIDEREPVQSGRGRARQRESRTPTGIRFLQTPLQPDVIFGQSSGRVYRKHAAPSRLEPLDFPGVGTRTVGGPLQESREVVHVRSKTVRCSSLQAAATSGEKTIGGWRSPVPKRSTPSTCACASSSICCSTRSGATT